MNHKPGTGMIRTGLLLIAAALLLTGHNLYQAQQASRSAAQAVTQLELHRPALPELSAPGPETEIPDYVLNPDMEMPVSTINGQDYIGVLEFPSLSLQLPVISQWSDARLKLSPCRYAGSAYTGDLVIAAHNYTAHFGRLNRLHTGDPITLTDVDGNRFSYVVAELTVLAPTAIEEMTSGGWDLTLFTCTLGGQSRLTVRCTAAEA